MASPVRERPAAVTVDVGGRELRLTNLGKTFYPASGFTKGDVIDYYARAAPVLLPHVRGRPMTLKRYPDGVAAPHTYDKHCPPGRPEWMRIGPMWSERKGEPIDFCLIDDLPSLIWSVNHANLEMHPLLSVHPDLDTPTVVAFDLDPGEPAGMLEAAEIARVLGDTLRGVGLESFPKTSGSRGVQVYVPLNEPVGFRETKAFARTVAELMAARMPGRVVASMARARRAGKVLVDWSQNDRHKSTVAPYSLRAKPGRPTVSMPVTWEELEAAVDAGDPTPLVFEAAAALGRIAEAGDRFAPVLSLRQALPR